MARQYFLKQPEKYMHGTTKLVNVQSPAHFCFARTEYITSLILFSVSPKTFRMTSVFADFSARRHDPCIPFRVHYSWCFHLIRASYGSVSPWHTTGSTASPPLAWGVLKKPDVSLRAPDTPMAFRGVAISWQ